MFLLKRAKETKMSKTAKIDYTSDGHAYQVIVGSDKTVKEFYREAYEYAKELFSSGIVEKVENKIFEEHSLG